MSGIDDVLAGCWKVILSDESYAAFLWTLEFCNMLWVTKEVFERWFLSRVAVFSKKGDLSICGNYRPIFSVCVQAINYL